MITRDEAENLVNKYLKNKENIITAYTVEMILRKIAEIHNRDKELWGLTGLLFSIDYEYTEEDKGQRGSLSSQILDGLLPEKAINAIKSNNYIYTDQLPVTLLDKVLISTSSAAEFILEIYKKSSLNKFIDIDQILLIEKLEDDSYISQNNKSRIKLCTDVGFSVEEFLKLCLDSMKEFFK